MQYLLRIVSRITLLSLIVLAKAPLSYAASNQLEDTAELPLTTYLVDLGSGGIKRIASAKLLVIESRRRIEYPKNIEYPFFFGENTKPTDRRILLRLVVQADPFKIEIDLDQWNESDWVSPNTLWNRINTIVYRLAEFENKNLSKITSLYTQEIQNKSNFKALEFEKLILDHPQFEFGKVVIELYRNHIHLRRTASHQPSDLDLINKVTKRTETTPPYNSLSLRQKMSAAKDLIFELTPIEYKTFTPSRYGLPKRLTMTSPNYRAGSELKSVQFESKTITTYGIDLLTELYMRNEGAQIDLLASGASNLTKLINWMPGQFPVTALLKATREFIENRGPIPPKSIRVGFLGCEMDY